MNQASFRMDLVGQGHLFVPEGCVRSIEPGRKPGQALVTFAQSVKHTGSKRRFKHHNGDGTSTVPVHGDVETLKGKLEALRGAGSDTKEEGTMNAVQPKEPWDMPYRRDRIRADKMGMSVSALREMEKRQRRRGNQAKLHPQPRKLEISTVPKVVKPKPKPAAIPVPTTEQLLAEAREELETAREMVAYAEMEVTRLEARAEEEAAAAKEDARKERLIELLQGGSTIEEALRLMEVK